MYYSTKKKAEILSYAVNNGGTATHKKYGVSKTTLRNWKRGGRRAAAKKATIDLSPLASMGATEEQIEQAVRWALHGYKEGLRK